MLCINIKQRKQDIFGRNNEMSAVHLCNIGPPLRERIPDNALIDEGETKSNSRGCVERL